VLPKNATPQSSFPIRAHKVGTDFGDRITPAYGEKPPHTLRVCILQQILYIHGIVIPLLNSNAIHLSGVYNNVYEE
jgi:hypothetical protein